MTTTRNLALAALLASLPAVAGAASITHQTFDTDPPTAQDQAAGVWYEDRNAPAGFSAENFMGDSRLKLELDESEGNGNRMGPRSSSFYDTQGRKYDTPGATTLQVDMYIDPAYQNYAQGRRVGGLWGSGVDAGGAITSYPTFDFIDGEFQVFDFINGGFDGIGTPTDFAYGDFATLQFDLDTDADMFSYLVNGEKLETSPANGTQELANGILQGINRPAASRSIYFDNFKASAVAPVPVPAAMPMFAVALSAMGFVARRRRRSAA